MPDSPDALRWVRQAAIHLRATRGRVGMVVGPQDADDLLIAGDLHGNRGNFAHIVRLADLEHQPGRHLVLQELVHGRERYPDGSDTSHRLLEMACALKCRFPHRVHILMGNHEMAEWTGREIVKDGERLDELFARGVRHAHGEAADEFIEAYQVLYASLPLAIRTESRVFVSHSIPPGRTLDQFDLGLFTWPMVPEDQRGRGTSVYWLLWGRDVSEETSARFARMIDADLLVTGHIRTPSGHQVPNSRQVILDCVDRPAACLLVPARGTLTHPRLLEGLRFLAQDA